MSRLLFHSSKRSAEKRRVMMDVHVVYTALMVFGCIVFRRVVSAEEDDPDIYFSCKDGFYRWKNKCYTFVMDRPMPWDKAQRRCTDNYLRVAEPTTSPYNKHIKATGRKVFDIARGNRFFIGLRKNSNENWRWESNNQPPKFTDWAAREELKILGNCAIISFEIEPVTWFDLLCYQQEYVICEYDTEVDECKSRSLVCTNGGTCIDTINTPARCSCPAPTTGRVCETDLMNQCASSPCRNTGTCNDLNFSYSCTCPPYWTGINCEKAVYACDSNPCERGKNCEEIANGYKCTCGGGPCIDTDDQCISNPCLQGSTCIDKHLGYTCACPPGMTGSTCNKTVDTCISNPCDHEGTCQQLTNKYTCSCTSKWTGTRCEEENECASNPCADRGVCSEHTSYFVCRCTTGFTGSSCQFKKPGELYHNCPEVVHVAQRLLCDCKILDPGEPAATVGWRDWRKPGSTEVIRTLEIPTVNKSDEGKTFTCQYTWNANGNSMKQVNYTLRMLLKNNSSEDKPQKPAVKIFPRNPFETDGIQPLTLFCDTTLDVQVNRAQWSGVNCQGGNYATSCTFTPDPTLDTGKKVKCTIHDPNIALDAMQAEYTLNFTWTGKAIVKCLQVESSDSDFFTDKTNEPYKLDCLAIGKPKPDIDVFLVAGSGSADTEVKQVADVDASIGSYRRQKVYTVMSPAVCQTNHTFRCYTKNSKGNHSKTITITAGCVSSTQWAAIDIFIMSSVGVGSGITIALLANSVRRRIAMRQIAG